MMKELFKLLVLPFIVVAVVGCSSVSTAATQPPTSAISTTIIESTNTPASNIASGIRFTLNEDSKLINEGVFSRERGMNYIFFSSQGSHQFIGVKNVLDMDGTMYLFNDAQSSEYVTLFDLDSYHELPSVELGKFNAQTGLDYCKEQDRSDSYPSETEDRLVFSSNGNYLLRVNPLSVQVISLSDSSYSNIVNFDDGYLRIYPVISPNGKYTALLYVDCVAKSRAIEIRSVPELEVISTIQVSAYPTPTDRLSPFVFINDSTQLAFAEGTTGLENIFHIYDLAGKEVKSFQKPCGFPAWLSDNLVVLACKNSFEIFEYSAMSTIASFDCGENSVPEKRFVSPNGRVVVCHYWTQEPTFKISKPNIADVIFSSSSYEAQHQDLAGYRFSADGSLLFYGNPFGDGMFRLINTETWSEIPVEDSGYFLDFPVEFSPNNQFLAMISRSDDVVLYDVQKQEIVKVFEDIYSIGISEEEYDSQGELQVIDIRFSPLNDLVAILFDDGTLIVLPVS